MRESLKYALVRTPLERPAKALRHLAGFLERRKHPELQEIHREDGRVERVLRKVLKPTDNCIDVGCHIGSFLSRLLHYAPRGKHMAFEALPDKAERLKKKFPDVEVLQNAAGADARELTFYRNVSKSGFSGMTLHNDVGDKIEELRVECVPLDQVVPADRPIAFMKVDVEGSELAVFKGAAQTIARAKPVILFECARDGLEGAKTTPQEMYDYITGPMGYDLYLLKNWLADGEALNFDGFKKAMTYPFQAFNYLAVPKRA